MPPVNRTSKQSGTGTAPSPNATNTTPRRSGKCDSCSSNHGTFLFASVSDAPPVTMTNAFAGNSRCFRHRFLSWGLKTLVSIPGTITRTPPQASAIGLRPAISASHWLFVTTRAPQFRYARNFRECAPFARTRFAGHFKIGQKSQRCVWLA